MTTDSNATESDMCPYQRPFRADFRDCPLFAPLLIRYDRVGPIRPSGPVLTCKHLVTTAQQPGSFYGRCELGLPGNSHELDGETG